MRVRQEGEMIAVEREELMERHKEEVRTIMGDH